MDLTDTLQQAITHHKAGELEVAEQLYRSILSEHPKHPETNHNLGVLLKQGGKAHIALPFFKIALESTPEQKQYWISYIDTLIHLRQYDTALNVLNQGQAKGLKGDAVDQLVSRLSLPSRPGSTTKAFKPGQLLSRAKMHIKEGEIQAARELYEQILEVYPQNSKAKKGL